MDRPGKEPRAIPARGFELEGTRGTLYVHHWPNANALCVALIAHGYGEHAGRYEHVAQRLVEHGAAVYAPDHHGHGRSDGERALVEKLDDLVDDLHVVAQRAAAEHPGVPAVLIGHSMGGMITARYAQLHGDELRALVLSGPAFGGNPEFEALLGLDPIPEVPIDPDVLSRDPAVGDAYASDPLVWHGPFKRQTLQALFAAIAAIEQGPSLTGLPVLWIHGEQDALAPVALARVAVRRLCGAGVTERVYPGARHEVLNETNRDEVLAEVVAFIARARGREARPGPR